MPISITLDQAQWNVVLNVLARAPFNEVAPLVLGIQMQLAQATGAQAPNRVAGAANGADAQAPSPA